jgi:hypothetical protein
MNNCISESEIDGECVDKLLKESIKDIQAGLCNTELALLRLVDNDEINPELWLSSYECNIQLINLVKELNIILKEIKPSAKALKIAHTKLDECIEKENRR